MITKEQALEAIEDMDDFARMADIEPIGAYNVLKQYVEQMEKKVEAFGQGIMMKQMNFLELCDLLPEGCWWGDTLKPKVLREVLEKFSELMVNEGTTHRTKTPDNNSIENLTWIEYD